MNGTNAYIFIFTLDQPTLSQTLNKLYHTTRPGIGRGQCVTVKNHIRPFRTRLGWRFGDKHLENLTLLGSRLESSLHGCDHV